MGTRGVGNINEKDVRRKVCQRKKKHQTGWGTEGKIQTRHLDALIQQKWEKEEFGSCTRKKTLIDRSNRSQDQGFHLDGKMPDGSRIHLKKKQGKESTDWKDKTGLKIVPHIKKQTGDSDKLKRQGSAKKKKIEQFWGG